MARLGVIASMQPTHATSDMPWAGDRIGSRRLEGAYAWRPSDGVRTTGEVLAHVASERDRAQAALREEMAARM